MKKYMNVFTDPLLLVVATITINTIPWKLIKLIGQAVEFGL